MSTQPDDKTTVSSKPPGITEIETTIPINDKVSGVAATSFDNNNVLSAATFSLSAKLPEPATKADSFIEIKQSPDKALSALNSQELKAVDEIKQKLGVTAAEKEVSDSKFEVTRTVGKDGSFGFTISTKLGEKLEVKDSGKPTPDSSTTLPKDEKAAQIAKEASAIKE